ncbi:MAG: hypothetical protein V5A49_12365 [Haloarcula sp.]
MQDTAPFIDPVSRELDLRQIFRESVPLLAFVVLFGGLALLPFLVVLLVAGNSLLGLLLTLLSQLILAVGTGVVLIYVVARGIQLSGT